MKAIETKYMSPTANKPSYIKATDMCDGNSIRFPYDYDLSDIALHHAAAKALCAKMQWDISIVSGGTKNGYVWVAAPVTYFKVKFLGRLKGAIGAMEPIEAEVKAHDIAHVLTLLSEKYQDVHNPYISLA